MINYVYPDQGSPPPYKQCEDITKGKIPKTLGVDEPWTESPPCKEHWYNGAAQFAASGLGPGGGRRCLVVGSPPFEERILREKLGWHTTHLDFRPAPSSIPERVRGDVLHLPFADDSFDAISCTCVLCHVGLGRYGDPALGDGERGDWLALAELKRVLKPGARMAVMFGPALLSLEHTVSLERTHLIYKPNEVCAFTAAAGLTTVIGGMWCYGWLSVEGMRQRMHNEGIEENIPYCYMCLLLEKGEVST